MVACEAAMVAVYGGTSNKVGNGFGVFFLFVFVTFYGAFVDAISYVYCSEIFPTSIRATGMGFSVVGLFSMTLSKQESFVQSQGTWLTRIQFTPRLLRQHSQRSDGSSTLSSCSCRLLVYHSWRTSFQKPKALPSKKLGDFLETLLRMCHQTHMLCRPRIRKMS